MSNVTRKQLNLRMDVARDVLTRIETCEISPTTGAYYKYHGATLRDYLDAPEKLPLINCRVCALGAFFVALLDKPNRNHDWVSKYREAAQSVKNSWAFTAAASMSGACTGETIYLFLQDVFDLRQLQLIECAFEGAENILESHRTELSWDDEKACNRYWANHDSGREALALICNNIIRHNGVFDPTDQL
jgi:hypothetical protein